MAIHDNLSSTELDPREQCLPGEKGKAKVPVYRQENQDKKENNLFLCLNSPRV
jgi:hypothetical protein